MPKTTFQRVIFTIIGVLLMATTMALFNKILAGFYEAQRYSGIFDPNLWKDVGIAFAQKAPLAFILQFFFVQKAVAKKVAKFPTDNKMLYRIMRVGYTACIMAPIMCVYSNMIYFFQFHWTVEYVITNILVKLAQNYIFAFGIQVIILNPLNGWIFRAIFRKQLQQPAQAK